MDGRKADITSIFFTAREIESSSRRAAFLDDACRGVPGLREHIEELLRSHEEAEAGGFLERPAVDFEVPPSRSGSLPHQYTDYELIDTGAFGKVYKAKNCHGNPVAVKILRDDLPTKAMDRFLREAARLKRMNHDNVVRYLGAGAERGHHYLAMEFVDGITLSKITSGEHDILHVSARIASGLEALHGENIIHRDIKPRNVITNVDFTSVKIVDLGVATCLHEDTLTAPAERIGTPPYMSPEQVSGRDVDARSDLFSLGAVMYFLVTSKSPFEDPSSRVGDPSIDTIFRNVLEKDVPPLAESHGTSRGLSDIISRLLAKNPDERFSNATDLLSALEDVQVQAEKTPSRRASATMRYTESPGWRRRLLEAARRQPTIHLARSEMAHKMKEQIRQTLATSNSIDHKFLYLDYAAVDRWTRITNADTYGLYHRCFNVCKRLCETQEWIEILTGCGRLRFIDLGVGTGDKDNWLVRKACQANDSVELTLVDSSFPMLELTFEQLDDDVNRFSRIHAVKGDFYNLREAIGQYLDSDRRETTRNVFLMLGGTFGNLDEESFLRELRRVTSPSDVVVVAVECFENQADIERLLMAIYNTAEVKSLGSLSIRHIEPGLSELEIVNDMSVRIVGGLNRSSVPGSVSAELVWDQSGDGIRVAKMSRYRRGELLKFIERLGFRISFEVKESAQVCPESTFSYLILTPDALDTEAGLS